MIKETKFKIVKALLIFMKFKSNALTSGCYKMCILLILYTCFFFIRF